MASRKIPQKVQAPSPIQQSSLPSLIQPVTPQPALTLADIQLALKTHSKDLEQSMSQKFEDLGQRLVLNEQAVAKQMEDLKATLLAENKCLKDDMSNVMECMAGRIEALEENQKQMREQDDKEIEEKREYQGKVARLEEENIMLHFKEMERAVRIRGIPENKQLDLERAVAEAFAGALDWRVENIGYEIEKVYRVNSGFARQRGLPRDVVVYFVRKRMRNDIMQAYYNLRFKVAGHEILLLKEIPSIILRRRKELAFLTDELKKRGIQFRWEIPVGIIFYFDGKRQRIITVEKAKEFYTQLVKTRVAERNGKEKGLLGKREEDQKEDEKEESLILLQEEEELSVTQAPLSPERKEQRTTRQGAKKKQQETEQKKQDTDQKKQITDQKRMEPEQKKQQVEAEEEYRLGVARGAEGGAVGGAKPKTAQLDFRKALLKLRGPDDGV